MKPFTFLLTCLLFFSCSEGTDIFNTPEESPTQYRETDFNFVLRAIHPNQEVDVIFGDGLRGRIPFRAAILLKLNSEIKGNATFGKGQDHWNITPGPARFGCESGKIRVIFNAKVRSPSEESVREVEEWIISLESTETNTDNPECLIWDIKDSDGSAIATFIADGKIWIKNSDCETSR